MRSLLSCVLSCGICTTAAFGEQPGVVLSEFVFDSAPFHRCHASTIVEAKAGLVAAWFGGTHEKHKDVGIWVAVHENGRWTRPFEVANGVQYVHPDRTSHRHPCWNPVLYRLDTTPATGDKDLTDGNERLLLFYKCGPSPSEWWGMLTTSMDGGTTWSLPRRLPEGIDGPVKNKPIRLDNGDLLCGSSTECDGWKVHFERTSDAGLSWIRIGPINDGVEIGAIQPSILQHGPDRLQAIGRSRQGKLWECWSDDHGQTWGPMSLTDLPNPNAGADAVTLHDGRHILIYNHTIRGDDHPRAREMLNVAVSDDGSNWKAAAVLEREDESEFSYPAVIQTTDGLVHVTYTWKRRRIRHVVLDPDRFILRHVHHGRWPN